MSGQTQPTEQMPSRHLSVVIATTPERAYAFAADLGQWTRWAAGLVSTDLRPDGDSWVADTDDGPLRIRLTPPNDLGVLDHAVTVPAGGTTHNPFRIMPHPDGCEAVFTIRRLAMTDAELDRDAGAVAADLARLRVLLEDEG